jgi:hypothetical protein
MVRMWFAIAAAGAIGCGDNRPGEPFEATSGSRLKIQRYVYEDGTEQWERDRFRDAEREEDCSPARWSDGSTYCTPRTSGTVFGNDTCTLELGRVLAGEPVPRYFLGQFWLTNRFFPSRLFAAGATTDAPADLFQQRDGSCEPIARGDGDAYYTLGTEVPRSKLVRIKRTEPPPAARLGLVLHTSDDGLHIPIAIHDNLLAVDCVVDERFDEATTRCMPSEYVDADYFRDPQCTVPEISTQTPNGIASIARVRSAATGCTRFHEVGRQTDRTSLYVQPGTSCIASIVAPDDNQFLVGAPLDLVTMSREPVPVPRRRLQQIRLGGELNAIDPFLADTETGADCRRTDVGGAIRCLPATSTFTQLMFGDATCASTIVVAAVSVRGCDLGSPFAVEPGDGAPVIHPLVGPSAVPLYQLTTGDRCVVAVAPPDVVMYETGPALPLEAFPAARVVVDR